MTVATAFDIEGFERATARGTDEPEALLDFFHEDVVWTEIDRLTPPSSPRVRRGHEGALELLRGVAERGIAAAVVDRLIAGDRGAIAIRCRYPDGRLLRENALVEIRDGKIARWDGVQAWDEQAA
jgi:ketosteroid isomerase-like protein